MSIESSKDSDIVIAGSGIAAAATALRLLSLGFKPRLVSLQRPLLEGFEAIPEPAFHLITDLGLDVAVAQSRGRIAEGFENAWDPAAPILRPGRWLLIERSAFALAAIKEAISKGAIHSIVRTLPHVPTRCLAAIDATGRSAAWSRPIHRQGNQVADLFELSSATERGRIERFADGWMYSIGSTLGIVNARRRPDTPVGARHLGRRPAFPQWCGNPIKGRRISVGDAAFAHDPIAGQGIRFALGSAFAAASLVLSWKEHRDRTAGNRFYRDFVSQARLRHLEFLDKLQRDVVPDIVKPLPQALIFAGRIGVTELYVDSRIVTDRAIVFADRSSVRWLAGVDLLQLAEVAQRATSAETLFNYLTSMGAGGAQAKAVLSWCIRKGILQESI